jgi:hypothetical protein
MRIRSYNAELAIATLNFARLFRNIVINRKDKDGKDISTKVHAVNASRSKVLKSFENAQGPAHFTTPLIAISRSGLTRDPSRLTNLHNEIRFSINNNINYDLYTPNPVTITFKVSIISRHQSDIDMILSNFVPFFNADLFVTTNHPKYTNLRYTSQIIMADNIGESISDINSKDQFFYITDCTFYFKTYIFGGSRQVAVGTRWESTPTTAVTSLTDPDTEQEVTAVITGTAEDLYDGFIPVIQSIHMDMHAVPRYDPFIKAEQGKYQEYDFDDYFYHFDNGHIPDPEYDCLDWIIDGVIGSGEEPTTISAVSVSSPCKNPGETQP